MVQGEISKMRRPQRLENLHGSIETTHFSPQSYDPHVPLAFYGAPFLPGEYHERVAPVDLAVIMASLADVNQMPAGVGCVLTEALKPNHPEGGQ